MATIYNSDLSRELIDGAKLQLSRDKIPTELAEKVVPVMEVNPKLLRRVNLIKNVSGTTTGALTVWTTPTDVDFYLTGVLLGVIKDATCDMATSQIAVGIIVDGVSKRAVSIPILTLTAQAHVVNREYTVPVKVDRGTTISSTANAYTAGLCSREVIIQGYTVENIRA